MGGEIMGDDMRLNAPTQMVFLISLILAVLAVVGHFVLIPYVTAYQFWIAIAGYVVLAAACVLKGV
jgi:hypothetical protein